MKNSTYKKVALSTLYYCLGIILVAVLYQLYSVYINKELFVPNLLDVFKSLFNLLGEKDTYKSICNTLFHLLEALSISFIIGLILGIISALVRPLYKIFKPLVSIFRILPIIIIIVVLLVSSVELKKIPVEVVAIILVPIFYEATYQGIISIDKVYIDVYKMHTNFNLRVVTNVYLPFIGRHLASAFIAAISLGIKAIVTAEYVVGANNTIGKEIINAMPMLEYVNIYAYSIILVIIIVIVEAIPYLVKFILDTIRKKSDEKLIKESQ